MVQGAVGEVLLNQSAGHARGVSSDIPSQQRTEVSPVHRVIFISSPMANLKNWEYWFGAWVLSHTHSYAIFTHTYIRYLNYAYKLHPWLLIKTTASTSQTPSTTSPDLKQMLDKPAMMVLPIQYFGPIKEYILLQDLEICLIPENVQEVF